MREKENPPPGVTGDGAGIRYAVQAPFTCNSAEKQHRLRDYQRAVIQRIDAVVESGLRKLILVAPTGSGKTVIAAAIIADAVARDRCVLFLVHRRELVAQSVKKLYAAGIDAGVILANGPAMRLHEPVQVAMIPTLYARAIRGSKIDLPEADLVIVDEAHHARARTWDGIIDKYPKAVIVGMTATPCRRDGLGLGNIFEKIIECPQIAELIQGHFLVPAKVYAPYRPDLKGVTVAKGDYVESQLEARMNTDALVGDIVEHYFKLARPRRTVVFASGVAHSVHLRDEFRRQGILAEHLDGSTPIEERERILKQLSDGTIDVVSNCMILTEGWDQPEVSCIVLARPTKSFGLYRQMIGRGLRPAEGKADLLILDHAGCVFTHGLPEDPVEWSLHADGRVANKAHAAHGQPGGMPKLVDCPECHAVRFQGQPCPACGWRPQPKPQHIDVVDGELALFSAGRFAKAGEWSERERCAFHAELRWIAAQRGYKAAWAAHKYREKTGGFPPWTWNHVEPKEPSPATTAWVRSRQIAYAKSQAKQRVA